VHVDARRAEAGRVNRHGSVLRRVSRQSQQAHFYTLLRGAR
jgi:arginase family enzyme